MDIEQTEIELPQSLINFCQKAFGIPEDGNELLDTNYSHEIRWQGALTPNHLQTLELAENYFSIEFGHIATFRIKQTGADQLTINAPFSEALQCLYDLGHRDCIEEGGFAHKLKNALQDEESPSIHIPKGFIDGMEQVAAYASEHCASTDHVQVTNDGVTMNLAQL